MRPILCILFFFFAIPVAAQQWALKTDLPYWLTATPNLGLEAGLSPRLTLDLEASANPFTFSNNRKWKHWMVRSELRYWLCERFYGHFFGIHLGAGEYNLARISLPWPHLKKQYRYEGWMVQAGVSYGYTWVLGKRWNLEATLGLGYIHADYKRFDCPKCGEYRNRDKKNYVAPTHVGVNLIYLIK